jgi:hypothetical protein
MTEPITDLSVAETAKLVGVSRARVYQRITGYAGAGDSGRPIDALIRTTNRPGTRLGRQMRVPLEAALDWRAERQLQDLPVGPLPDWYTESPEVLDDPRTLPPDAQPLPIGLPVFRPF